MCFKPVFGRCPWKHKKNEELDFNEGIQYSNVANSSSTNRIPSSNKDVNTTTKYSIQESENNSLEMIKVENSEAKYIDNKSEEHNIYFRFDDIEFYYYLK